MIFHNIYDKIKHYKIYRKMVLSYLLIVIVTVLFVCSFLFSLFSTSSAKEISSNSLKMQSQISYSADILYKQVQNLSAQLISNQDVLNYLYMAKPDVVKKFKAYLVVNSLKASYSYIQSIGLYNGTNGDFLNPYGMTKEEIISMQQKLYMRFTPRVCDLSYMKKPAHLLSFVMYPNLMLSVPKCAIIINVDESYIRSLIRDISSDSGSATLVIDVKGKIISEEDSAKFMADISGENYIQAILTSGQPADSFTTKVDGAKSLVTYVKSDNLDWYFVRIQTYSTLLQNINTLRDITMALALVLMVAGITFSFFMISNLYNPMKRLLEKTYKSLKGHEGTEKYDEYELLSEAFTKSNQLESSLLNTINSSKKYITEKFLLNVLKGNPGELVVPDDILNELNDKLKGDFFCVLLFKVDKHDAFNQMPHKDQSIARFALCNVAHELLEKVFPNDALIAEEDEIVSLAKLDSDKLSGELILALHEIQGIIKERYHITVSVSIGDVVNSVFDIQNSYSSAQEYMKYRLFYSWECIIDRKKISDRLNVVSKYPAMFEKKLIDAIQLRSDEIIKNNINEFVCYLSGISYYQAINYSNQLMLSLIKNFEGTIHPLDENLRDYYDVIGKMDQAETLEDVTKIIYGVCSGVCRLIDEKSKNISEQKYVKLIEDAKAFILSEHQNSHLSLEIVAEHVKLSCSYFGKLFKSVSGLSYNEFLNNVRLEKAMHLLSETNEPAVRISEKVGFNNIAYFSTMYKKKYGVPPSVFREQEALKGNRNPLVGI